MFEFFSDADIYLKTFLYIAIPVSTIFILQTILTFIGGGDADMDTDTDATHIDSAFELFTLRNLINFLLGFSWAGIGFYHSIDNKILLIAAAIVVGVIFVTLFFYIIQQIKKLEEDNTFDITQIKGLEAIVYLRIPARDGGTGKIQVSHKGRSHVLDAISIDELIPTGAKVVIIEVYENQLITVQRID